MALELTAPDGYELPASTNERMVEFEIQDGQTTPVELVIKNGETNMEQGLKILKVDADNPSKTLSGAKFSVYKGAGTGGEKVGDFTTGAGGMVAVPLTDPGEYTIVEVTPPTGYEISNPNSQTVTIAENETKEVKFSNQKKSTPPPGDSDTPGEGNAEGQITIVKKDGLSHRDAGIRHVHGRGCPRPDQ